MESVGGATDCRRHNPGTTIFKNPPRLSRRSSGMARACVENSIEPMTARTHLMPYCVSASTSSVRRAAQSGETARMPTCVQKCRWW